MALSWVLLYWYHNLHGTLPWVETNFSPESYSASVNEGADEVFDASLQFKKYNNLYDALKKMYYDKDELNVKEMQENALKWFVDAIGDPYTVYLTEEENQVFDEWMQWSQNFEWIGAIVTKKEDGILIETVLKWSPAFKAWILPLDLILQIDGEPTWQLWLNEWVQLIRWPEWSEVVLTIMREWEDTMIEEITVTRWKISVPSVEVKLVEEQWKKILHAIVSVFWDDTMVMFEREVKAFSGMDLDWIILDLRGNWWWYLPIAVELASHFLPKNEVITTARYTIFDDEIFRSQWYNTFSWIPVVVLIDWLSASASEIIAWALDERWDAELIWTKSFWKWSIQTIQTNPDNSSLKLTIGKRYLPSDDNVDERGVEPDQTIEFDIDAYIENWTDNQLDAAIEYFVSWNTNE